MRELTIRSIVLGGLLTFIFTAANIYFGLRVGLTFSTAIPAAVISMALLRILGGATIVENNIVQTIGSAAGAVATMIFILPGLVIVGWWSSFPYWTTMLVSAIGGVLGVMLSVPMRRALVIDSALPYPEGVAGAEILRVGMADEAGARENQAGLATLVLGAVVAAGCGLLTAIGLAAAEVQRSFKLFGGVSGLGFTTSLGLLGVGHLIGLGTGLAMLVGVVLARFVLLPLLSGGMAGPIDEVAATVFAQQVRFVGAGAIAVAALWALVRIAGSIMRGLAGIAATARARKAGAELAVSERDLPGSIVLGICLALVPAILVLLWQFVQGGPLAGRFAVVAVVAVLFIAVVGVVVAAVTGYMAGLIGTSNSPVSGVGILAILIAALLVAVLFGAAASPEATAPLIAFALFVTAFVFGIALISNDNLQDLKTGQLVGSTPWKQQVALVIGVVAGSLVIPPVLNLVNATFGFAGAPGAGPQALAAPQASLISAIAQGVLGGSLRWDLIGIGAAIAVVVIVIDEALAKAGRRRLPPLAVAMGIYLPATVTLVTISGAIIGHRWDRMALGTARPEFVKRMGVLLATGLVVGDSLYGLAYSGAVAATGDATRLFAVGPGFAPWADAVAIAVLAGGTAFAYARTRRLAKGSA